VNSTETVNLRSATVTSHGSLLASDAKTRGTWATQAGHLGMTAKPANPRSLSPLEWLSP
jgi:hypothetical protein